MAHKKATEDQFNELHNLVTKEFLARIKSGEASTQDLKAACDWLKANDISGIAYDGNPLDKLAAVIPQVDPEFVKSRLYGKRELVTLHNTMFTARTQSHVLSMFVITPPAVNTHIQMHTNVSTLRCAQGNSNPWGSRRS